jgi:carboxypeptidase Taq
MDSFQRNYERLCAHTREVALLSSTQELLEWDERTKMPPAGGAYRAEQISYLAGLIHKRQTEPEVGHWLGELAESPLADDPHGDAGAVIRNLQRDYDKATKLPQALVEELARTAVLGQQVWAEARAANDFARFRPLLDKTIGLKRQEADALLDDYEPGARTSEVRQVLAALRDELVPLVAEIAASPHRPKTEILQRRFPVEQQAAFGSQAATAIGFDFQSGRLDVTNHPFCCGVGPCDTRLTPRYNEHDFSGGLFSILHEAGHGIYDQGLPKENYGLPTGEAVSLGVHESQSRLWENLVGRSRGFWQHFYPIAQSTFSESLGEVPPDDFYFAINDVRPSLIRTEADEVTYNLHVLVRFELEQALLEDDLRVADLPGAWNEKYRNYLGIESPTDANGVLQDVHWSAGLFGYFPTYSLGNLYASQLFDQARRELGDLEMTFASGQFHPLQEWLQIKMHRQGRRYPAADLIQQITGQPISPTALIAHLRRKFSPLYELK